MSPAALERALEEIGWGKHGLHKRLKIHQLTTWRWFNGKAPIPKNVVAWLTALAEAHRANPAPYWRTVETGRVAKKRYPGVSDRYQPPADFEPPPEPEVKRRRRVYVARPDPISPTAINADTVPPVPRVRPGLLPEPAEGSYRIGQDDTLRYRVQQRRRDPWED